MNYETMESEVRRELDERSDLQKSFRFMVGLGLLSVSVFTIGQAALQVTQLVLNVTI